MQQGIIIPNFMDLEKVKMRLKQPIQSLLMAMTYQLQDDFTLHF